MSTNILDITARLVGDFNARQVTISLAKISDTLVWIWIHVLLIYWTPSNKYYQKEITQFDIQNSPLRYIYIYIYI